MKLERNYSETEKKEFVQTFIVSGDSMNHWCRGMNLPYSTFHGWVKKYKKVSSPDFIEVNTTSDPRKCCNKEITIATSTCPPFVIEYRDFKIRVEANANTEFL